MRIKNLFIAAIAVLSLASCKKFLEQPPEGKLKEEDALVDEASLQSFLNGTFNTQANEIYNGRLWFISDLMSDEANGILYSEDFGEIYNRKTSIFGAYKNDTYTRLYQNVYRANKVLENIGLASANKNKIEGEARFIRALMHFEAVRLWAQPWGFTSDNSHLGVPIRTTANIDVIGRSTVKQVYDFIIEDLKAAENLLGDAVVLGYPSKWSAKALLAKIYFQQNNFPAALDYSTQVINSNKFYLDADHDDRFSLSLSDEVIYGFKYTVSVLETGAELRDRYRSDVGFSPNSDFKVTDQFFNLATQPGDERGAWYTTVTGYHPITKYNKDRFDVAVIHLTEIMLIRAESAAEVGGATNIALAIEDMNEILERAYAGTTHNLATNSIAADIIRVARMEREFEMIGEGNRLQEIKRISARTSSSPDRRGAPLFCPGLVLQFPQGEKAGNTEFVMNIEGGCN